MLVNGRVSSPESCGSAWLQYAFTGRKEETTKGNSQVSSIVITSQRFLPGYALMHKELLKHLEEKRNTLV